MSSLITSYFSNANTLFSQLRESTTTKEIIDALRNISKMHHIVTSTGEDLRNSDIINIFVAKIPLIERRLAVTNLWGQIGGGDEKEYYCHLKETIELLHAIGNFFLWFIPHVTQQRTEFYRSQEFCQRPQLFGLFTSSVLPALSLLFQLRQNETISHQKLKQQGQNNGITSNLYFQLLDATGICVLRSTCRIIVDKDKTAIPVFSSAATLTNVTSILKRTKHREVLSWIANFLVCVLKKQTCVAAVFMKELNGARLLGELVVKAQPHVGDESSFVYNQHDRTSNIDDNDSNEDDDTKTYSPDASEALNFERVQNAITIIVTSPGNICEYSKLRNYPLALTMRKIHQEYQRRYRKIYHPDLGYSYGYNNLAPANSEFQQKLLAVTSMKDLKELFVKATNNQIDPFPVKTALDNYRTILFLMDKIDSPEIPSFHKTCWKMNQQSFCWMHDLAERFEDLWIYRRLDKVDQDDEEFEMNSNNSKKNYDALWNKRQSDGLLVANIFWALNAFYSNRSFPVCVPTSTGGAAVILEKLAKYTDDDLSNPRGRTVLEEFCILIENIDQSSPSQSKKQLSYFATEFAAQCFYESSQKTTKFLPTLKKAVGRIVSAVPNSKDTFAKYNLIEEAGYYCLIA